MIEHIEGIEIDFVAQCLGVDGKKYKYATAQSGERDDENPIANPIMKSETTQKLQDRSVAHLKIMCPFCAESYDFPEIYHTNKGVENVASNVCPNKECSEIIPQEYISNRVQLFLKQLTMMYYRGKYFHNFSNFDF